MAKAKQEDVLVVDTREQRAYWFRSIPDASNYRVTRGTLPIGDYGSSRQPPGTWWYDPVPELCCVIERKSLADLYSTMGQRREQFQFQVLSSESWGYYAIVIEADFAAIMNPNAHLKHETQMNPRSVVRTLAAWSQRHGIHVWWMPGREVAEAWTFRLLDRWVKDGRTASDE